MPGGHIFEETQTLESIRENVYAFYRNDVTLPHSLFLLQMLNKKFLEKFDLGFI